MDDRLLRDELVRDEGLRLAAYKDSVGLWTIGVGHLLGHTQRMTAITKTEADALLAVDIYTAMETADRWIPEWRQASEARQRALVNMAFNLGNRLQTFKRFRASVARGDWKRAAVEMLESKWAQQVGPRALRLRDMIRDG